jgi:hypothetical protein
MQTLELLDDKVGPVGCSHLSSVLIKVCRRCCADRTGVRQHTSYKLICNMHAFAHRMDLPRTHVFQLGRLG